MKYRKSDAIWYPQDNKNVGLFDYYISCYIGYLDKNMGFVMIYISRYKNNGIVSTRDENEKWTTEKESIIITVKDYILYLLERERERERGREQKHKLKNNDMQVAY